MDRQCFHAFSRLAYSSSRSTANTLEGTLSSLKYVISCCLVLLVWRIVNEISKWLRLEAGLRRIPLGPPIAVALNGLMSKQIHQNLLRWTNRYGDIFRIHAANRHVGRLLEISCPSRLLVEQVLLISDHPTSLKRC